MNNNSILILPLLIVISAVFIQCKSEADRAIDELEKASDLIIEETELSIQMLEQADSAEKTAEALNEFMDAYMTFNKKIGELQKNHSEIEDRADLERMQKIRSEFLEKWQKLQTRFEPALAEAMNKYQNAPQVQKTLFRMEGIIIPESALKQNKQ